MENREFTKDQFHQSGFAIVTDVFSQTEIESIGKIISDADAGNPNFRKSTDLFAIRQFFKEIPDCIRAVFNNKLRKLISAIAGDDYFVVKAIYFDKPGDSNWFVPYHQDLMISVNQKTELPGYSHWSVKQDYVAVQPPVSVLEHTITLRIHLDDTDEQNGALYVIPASHSKGVYRPEHIDWSIEREVCCSVPVGGVMLMRPLLLHSSRRTTNSKNRRVIHIELSNKELPAPVDWYERDAFRSPYFL